MTSRGRLLVVEVSLIGQKLMRKRVSCSPEDLSGGFHVSLNKHDGGFMNLIRTREGQVTHVSGRGFFVTDRVSFSYLETLLYKTMSGPSGYVMFSFLSTCRLESRTDSEYKHVNDSTSLHLSVPK